MNKENQRQGNQEKKKEENRGVHKKSMGNENNSLVIIRRREKGENERKHGLYKATQKRAKKKMACGSWVL